jgi:hypothetical protein
MKKLAPNFLALLFLAAVILLGNILLDEGNDYWHFLTHHMVLNIGSALIAITIGLLVKNYFYVIIGSSFVLLVYCLIYMFSPGSALISQFFLALYTIFLGFSVLANLCRHYKDWILAKP